MANIFQDIQERLGQFGELVDVNRRKLEAQKQESTVKARLDATLRAKQAPSTNLFRDVSRNIIEPIVKPSVDPLIRPKPLPPRKDITPEQREAGQKVIEFGKEVLRAGPRAGAAVTLDIKREKEFTPQTGFERFLLGKRPVEAVTTQVERFPKRAEEIVGLPQKFGKPLAPIAVGIGTILDLIPGLPGKGRLAKELAEEGTEAGIKAIFKRNFPKAAEQEVDDLARRFAPIKDPKVIERELDELARLKKAGKVTDEALEARKGKPKPGLPEVTPTPKAVNIFEDLVKPPEVPVRPPEVAPKPPEITPKPPEPTPIPPPAPEAPVAPVLPIEPPVKGGARPFIKPSAGQGVGVLPSEAKAVSERFPTEIVPTKTRKFLTSVGKRFPEVGEEIKKVSGQYVPRSTDQLAIKARSLVKENIDAAESLARAGADENSVATASELIKHYNDSAQKAGKLNAPIFYEKAADIAHDMAAKLTEQGRSVQAASIIGRLTPEGILRFAASEINRYNRGILEVGRLQRIIPKKIAPQLNAQQTEFILNEAKRITSMPDGVEKAMAFKKLNDFVADLLPSTLYKKLVTLWKAGLLTGIKTSGLNVFSNLSHGFSEIIKDLPAVAIDSASSLLTGKRTIGLTPKGYLEGVRAGFKKGVRYFKTGFDERDVSTKLDIKRVKFGDSKFAKGLQTYTDTVFRVLGSEDQPFYYGAKSRSLMDQAIAQAKNQGLKGDDAKKFIDNLIENPTDDMLKYAAIDAETAVFTNRTLLGDIARGLQRLPGGEIVVPFGRTPSAVATQIINYSPVGIVKSIFQNIGKGRFDQRLFAQAMGRGLVGTGVLATGAALFSGGLMTLDRPKNEREQKLWELEGRSANSIKLGGKWRSAQVLGPAGNVLMIGGHFQNAMNEEGSPTKAIVKAIAGGAKSFTEQTFLRGVNQFVTSITDPERSFEYAFTNFAGSTVPTLVADLARATDVVERRYQGPLEKIKSRIPFLRETLEPAITVFGKEVPRYGGNVMETMIDPTRPSVIRGDEVVEELRRLWDADQKVTPTLLGDRKGYDALTPEQNTELWEKTGQLVESKLRNLFQLDAYKELDDEGKGKAVEKVVDKAKDIARASAALELTQDLSGEELKAKLSDLKRSGILTKAVFEKYLELR